MLSIPDHADHRVVVFTASLVSVVLIFSGVAVN